MQTHPSEPAPSALDAPRDALAALSSASPPSPAPPRPTAKWLAHPVFIFGASLAIRLTAWALVASAQMPVILDELTYARRADVMRELLESRPEDTTPSGRSAREKLWTEAYDRGVWPPLHSILIALVFTYVSDSNSAARLLVAILSALTTPVAYALAGQVAGRRAAACTGWLHALYPSFIAFSHLLWAETTFILPMLLSVWLATRALDAERLGAALLQAALAGAALGAAALVRASALPLMLAVPFALLISRRRWTHRAGSAGALLLACGVVLLPWHLALWRMEGRFVLLSAANGYNLLLGNNPWSEDVEERNDVSDTINRVARQRGISRFEAAQAEALAYIQADVWGFAARVANRLRHFVVSDWFVVRHVVYGVYPPTLPGVPTALLALLGVSLVVVLAGAARGFALGGDAVRHRGLIALAIGLMMLIHAVSMSNSRLALPMIALLLPISGAGIADVLSRRAWRAGLTLLACTTAGFWALNPRAPGNAMHSNLWSTSYYRDDVPMIAALSGLRLSTIDVVELRRRGAMSPRSATISLASEGYVFSSEGAAARVWAPYAMPRVSLLLSTEQTPRSGPRVHIESEDDERVAEFDAVHPAAWRRETPSGMEGVVYSWRGVKAFAERHRRAARQADRDGDER